MINLGLYERFLAEEVRPGILLLTMNRPEKLNAMDPLFFRELRSVTQAITEAPGIAAVILTGSGRAFSAGGDIATFPTLTESPEGARMHLRLVFDSFHSLERCRVPIIAAVNGIAHGGGLEILGGVDYCVAARTATLGFREAAHGLVPSYGALKFQHMIGRARTFRLVGSAEVIDAQTALDWGIVQEVVDVEQLVQRCIDLAETFVANPDATLHTLKSVLNRNSAEDIAMAVEATALLFAMPDTQTRIGKFLNRPRN